MEVFNYIAISISIAGSVIIIWGVLPFGLIDGFGGLWTLFTYQKEK